MKKLLIMFAVAVGLSPGICMAVQDSLDEQTTSGYTTPVSSGSLPGLDFEKTVFENAIRQNHNNDELYQKDADQDVIIDANTNRVFGAGEIGIVDTEGYYEGIDVEVALKESGRIFTDLTDDAALVRYTTTHAVDGSGVWTETVTQNDSMDLEFNIGRTHLKHTSDVMTVDLSAFVGTDANPSTVYTYVINSGGTPALTASNTSPDGLFEHVNIAHYKAGAITAGSPGSVTLYGGVSTTISGYEFVALSYHKNFDDGSEYRKGIDITATPADLVFGPGIIRTIFDMVPTDQQQVSIDGLYYVDSAGVYGSKTDFSFTHYATGEAITAGKYYNVILGVIQGNGTEIIALVQAGDLIPAGKEYKNAKEAVEDKYGVRILIPSDTLLKALFVPIARIVILNDASDELQEMPEPGTGIYSINLRGNKGGSGGGVSSSVTIVQDLAIPSSTSVPSVLAVLAESSLKQNVADVRVVTAGTGITLDDSPAGTAGDPWLLNSDIVSISGIFVVPVTAVAANTCVSGATYQDVATGVAVGDVVIGNFNSAISGKTGYGALATDGLKVNPIASTDTITFETCNVTDTSITPSAISIFWQVIK